MTRDPNEPNEDAIPAEQLNPELDTLWIELCEGNGTPEQYERLEELQNEAKGE